MIVYHIPPKVLSTAINHRPILTTSSGGKVVVDRALLSLWKQADECELNEITKTFGNDSFTPKQLSAALACLAEAGLLVREETLRQPALPSLEKNPPVSVIIVSYNNRPWLENSLPSLFSQTYTPFEAILVDNGSQDGSAKWAALAYPDIKIIRLEETKPLAHTLNRGISAAQGQFCLLLNPDVILEPTAIAHMVGVAQEHPGCAAVAAKLKLLWAPAFLNGLGNYVGAFSWGTDSALGHLDLGQFDGWEEIPSACFAAALISSAAWKDVGPLDEGFPMYYEDSEWCYRARLFGYSVRAAPQAVVYHALSGRMPGDWESGLTPSKLQRVAYGRLRFTAKLLSPNFLLRFLLDYLLEDSLKFILALLCGRWAIMNAYLKAWGGFFQSLPALTKERKNIQARRKLSDKILFALQREIPAPLIWRGLPLLTWDLVCNEYLPRIVQGQTREMPEYGAIHQSPLPRQPLWQRAIRIWRLQGLAALLHHLGRQIEWFLMQA